MDGIPYLCEKPSVVAENHTQKHSCKNFVSGEVAQGLSLHTAWPGLDCHWHDASGENTQLASHTFTHPKETPTLLCPRHTHHWAPPKQPLMLTLPPDAPAPQESQEEPQEMSTFYPNFDSDILCILKT